MGVYITKGTGKAKCGICHKLIEKGQKSINVFGWRFQQQVHSNPKECDTNLR